MIGRPRKIGVGALVLLLLLSSVLPKAVAEDGQENIARDSKEGLGTEPLANDIQPEDTGFELEKISQNLLGRLNSKEKIPVVIATTNISELSDLLRGSDFDGILGTKDSRVDGVSLPLLKVPGYIIRNIASLSSTIFVEKFEPPVRDYAPSYEPLRARSIIANNLNATINHKANLAWSKGFTGKGVKIAVIDDGIDFAHPDLMDKMARVDSVFLVENETIVESASSGQRLAAINNFDIVDQSVILYRNGNPMSPGNYNVNLWNGTIIFTSPLAFGDNIKATYKFYSPYYGWPIAFDPASLRTLIDTRYPTDTWYANTTSKDRNVTHTVKIDGRFDFWDDGSELVATDSSADIITHPGRPAHEGNDYNVISLYVTQDADNWYFGFDTLCNQTTMKYGLYINTTNSPPWTDGGSYDPENRNPVTNQTLIDAIPEHRPEIVVYITHQGGEERANWSKNDTIEDAMVYIWDQASGYWNGYPIDSKEIGGEIAYSGWDFEDLEGIVEFSIPKSVMGNPVNISVELFTTGYNISHAQDTAYTDPNIPTFTNPDWDLNLTTTLSAFTIVGKDYANQRGFWRHTYTRIDDTVAGVPNTNMTWPLQFIPTGTSKSGVYWYGDHPDENYPLTRILVVDEAVPGIYDTVYMDLDHNRDFRNDKPTKRYGKYDAQMNWHPPDWTGNGTIYTDVAYGDFYDPAKGITSIDWSPDGTKIASGSDDHTIVIWDLGPPISYEKQLHAHYGRVKSVRWSPNGTWLAAAYDDRSGKGDFNVAIWDVANGSIVKTLRAHTDGVLDLDWSPTGTRLVSVSLDSKVIIWNAVNGGVDRIFTDHNGPVYDVHWASDGRIATASEDMTVKIWDANGTPGSAVLKEYTYTSPLTAVAINTDQNWLAYGASDGWITIVDMTTDNSFTDLPHNEFHTIWTLKWAPGGMRLLSTASSDVTSTSDPTIAVWEWLSPIYWDYGYKQLTGKHDGESVRSGSWSTNETTFVTGGDDLNAQLWTCVGSPLSRVDPNGQPFKGHQEGSLDYTRWNTGDGLPDVSGGMVYYIAQHRFNPVIGELQEVPIPYSETFVARLGGDVQNFIAENGTLVAIMGNLDADQGHGTLVASAISGQGKSDYFDPTRMDLPTRGHVIGFAPDAKLIPVANIYVSNFYDGWYFAVEGYDGIRNSGDEPQIVTNSFGFSSVDYTGFDFKSRFLDWLVNEYAQKKITFTFSAGNNGYGYGTISTPGSSPGVITVGSSTDFFYRHLSGLEKGANPSYGDTAYESSRGPTMMGEPDPDILANGRMAFGDVALNMVDYRPYDGSQATNLWAGTSLASPGVAGMLSLAFQAYKEKHGIYPDSDTAKSLVMSSGDDINYDVFSQGAGLLNAERLTNIASGSDGIQVSPNNWVPGNYQGVRYPSFAKLMYPGQKEDNNETFVVRNHNPSSQKMVEIYDAVYRKIDEVNYSFATLAEDRAEWHVIFASSRFAIRDPVGNPGIYTPGVYDMQENLIAPINLTNWLNCDLLRITMYMNWTNLDENADGNPEYSYFLDIYDWTFVPGSTTNLPHTGDYSDMNRMLIVYPDANIFEGRIHNPAQRTHDGLVIGARPGIQPNRMGNPQGYITVSLEFFEKRDWSWLTTDKSSLTILPDSNESFNAVVDVPMGASVGTYQGGIYLKTEAGFENETTVIDNTYGPRFIRLERYNIKSANVYLNGALQTEGVDYAIYPRTGMIEFFNPLNNFDSVTVNYTYYEVITIPVSVNVPSDSIEFSFGGIEPGQDDLYSNRVNGGFGNGARSGEWRYYFVDVPDQGMFKSGLGSKFMVDAKWDMPRTDIDVLAYGPGGSRSPVDPKEVLSPLIYGPYELFRENGGSEETATFFTTTGLNEEVVAPRISGGLNVIAIHQVRLNGTLHSENVSGNVATMSVVPEEVKIVTNKLTGQRNIQLHSTIEWDGIGSQSAGPSPPVREVNVHIKQDNIEGESFIKLLAEGDYTKIVRVQKTALIFAVNITSLKEWTEKPCPDLDLGIFLDGKGPDNIPDGEATEDEFVAYDADADAEEQIRLIKPPVFDDPDTPFINEEEVGVPYIIKVLGFTVPGNDGTFNIDVTLVQGEGFEVEGLKEEGELWGPLTLSEIALKWNLPGNTTDGELLGALYLGPSRSPFTVLVPIELVVDRVKPSISDFALRTIGKELDVETGRITNHKQPDISCTLRDTERGELDESSIRVFFDGENVTSQADILLAVTEIGGKYGYFEGTVTYTPPSKLKDGIHRFEVWAADMAGNENYGKMEFMVDSTSPDLVLEGGLLEATSRNVATISGWTEPDKRVMIREKSVVSDENGYFQAEIELLEGLNIIDVVVVDFLGITVGKEVVRSNANTMEKIVIYDTIAPSLMDLRFDVGSPTRSEVARLTGRVEEMIANATPYDPRTVKVDVNGEPVQVESDGSFEVMLHLTLADSFLIRAEDMAGNSVSVWKNLSRDVIAPELMLEDLPSRTVDNTIWIRGSTEPGSIVMVNGKLVSVGADGSFEEKIALRPGANLIVVEARDSAGNLRVSRMVVDREIPDPTPWIFLFIAALIALIIGLLLGSSTPPEMEEEEIEKYFEEGIPEEVEEEDPRIEKLRKAYEEGKLSRELYELNLKKLKEK